MENTKDNIISYLENALIGFVVCEYDEEKVAFTPIYHNEGLGRILGYKSEEMDKYIKNIRYCVIPEDIPAFDQSLQECLRADGDINIEVRTITGKGEMRWLYIRANLYSRIKTKSVIVAAVMDVTEKKNGDEELRAQAERMHLIDTVEKESIFDYNVKADTLLLKYVDENKTEREEYVPDYVQKFNPTMYNPKDVEPFLTCLTKLIKGAYSEEIKVRSKRIAGEYREYNMMLTSIVGPEGYVTRIVGRFYDTSKKDEETKKEAVASSKEYAISDDLPIREGAMRILYDEMATNESWLKVFDMIILKMGWQMIGVFPPCKDEAKTNFMLHKREGINFEFEDDKAVKRAAAVFEDLFRTVKSTTSISEREATVYSHTLTQFMADYDFERIIYYPFSKGDEYLGCLVMFNPVYETEKFDNDYFVKKQRMANQIFSLIDTLKIQLDNTVYEPREMMIRLMMLDTMSQYVYLVDYDTKKIVFANSRVFEKADVLKMGTDCFEALQEGASGACEDCLIAKMDPNNQYQVETADTFNYNLRTWVKMSVTWFVANDKHRICMLAGTDISDYFVN